MNRFFRTAFSVTLICLCLTLFTVLLSGVGMPFPAFSCLYFGLLTALLPGAVRKLSGREVLFYLLGTVTALLGFIPLMLKHCPASHFAIHLAGIAAAAAFIPLLRHRTTHDRFLAKYQFTAVSLLLMFGLICLVMLTDIRTDGEAARTEMLKLAVNNAVPYAIVLLVTGVLLLRGLRASVGTVNEQAFNRRQLRDTLIFAAVVTLVFAADPFAYLKQAAFFLFNDVLQPAARFIAAGISALLRLLSVRRPEEIRETQATEEAPELRPVSPSGNGGAVPGTEHYDIESEDLARVISYVFFAAAAAVLLWLLARQILKLTRDLRKRAFKWGSGYPREVREMIPQEEGPREDRPKKRSADPRERMRYLYGDFLRYLKKLRVRFTKADTADEIRISAEGSSVADPAELSEFTELYEEARYQLEEMPSEEDARRMKNLFDKIKKKG